jgi:hypothetical protein
MLFTAQVLKMGNTSICNTIEEDRNRFLVVGRPCTMITVHPRAKNKPPCWREEKERDLQISV